MTTFERLGIVRDLSKLLGVINVKTGEYDGDSDSIPCSFTIKDNPVELLLGRFSVVVISKAKGKIIYYHESFNIVKDIMSAV